MFKKGKINTKLFIVYHRHIKIYLKHNPNTIIEQTRSILNNEKQQPIKQPIIKQSYQRPKTQTEWSNFHKMNEDGIKQAYNKPEGYHIEGNKLYIAGTRGLSDVLDWYKIPLGTFNSSHIYIYIKI